MLFRAFYSPETLTSFDDLLSRPYLSAVGSTPQPAAPSLPAEPTPADAAAAAAEAARAAGEYPRFEGSPAPRGWLSATDEGVAVEHPLWTRTVTWGGTMRHSPMHETLQL